MFSIIIPVFDRPQEIDELLNSLLFQNFNKKFEIVIIEDGSTNKCDEIVNVYQEKLTIKYLFKENSGPGQSRNYGMERASGDYFIILDSDVILPKNYLTIIAEKLKISYTELFAAPDKSHASFTEIQKAINYAMTSFLTTGGLRNNKGKQTFQLRSFNMGMSKKAFIETKGFSKQNFGEDIDLSFRVDILGLSKQYIPNGIIYHKRRTDWLKFYQQTSNFGKARPVLNRMHGNVKLTYWFPSFFIIGLLISIIALLFSSLLLYILYTIYFLLIFMHALLQSKDVKVALFSVQATFIQFLGYGLGFIKSQIRLHILKKSKEDAFPKMFS